MRKIKIDKDYVLTNTLILDLLKKHKLEVARLNKLLDYYNNKNAIMHREYRNPNRPQNRISHGYAQYITDTATGYLLGKPVSYTTEQQDILKEITKILKYNDEADTNTTLAKQASIYGYSYEIMYTDSQAKLRFKPIDPAEMIVCVDNTLEENIALAIRYYNETIIVDDKEKVVTHIEAYTKPKYGLDGEVIENGIKHKYTLIDDTLTKDAEGEEEYYFMDIPVTMFINNDEMYGDFERVLTLIDAYDKSNSDTANDFEYITNCILVVSGEIMDEEARSNLDEQRVINFIDSSGKAEYLMKDIKDAALENYKNRLDNDIHKFAQIPNMSDENFSSNASGVSMAYKLMALENKIGVKESKFKKGLMRRIELICDFLKVKAKMQFDFLDIEPVFTRNKPNNLVEIADVMTKLQGLLSDETIISLFPQVSDVQAELDRRAREEKESFDNTFGQDYQESAPNTPLNVSKGDVNEK